MLTESQNHRAKTQLKPQDSLRVQILSAKGTLWEGDARAVSSVNSQGPFDLLPEHAHFISLVENNQIVIHTSDGQQRFTFETAVVRLIDNVVTVYVDIS